MNEGELFRKLRKDRGFSLEQVSDEINSVSFISKFEKGQSNPE
ncbi:helix-turn-helix domain-containing protein [Vagococcus carniphilus]